MNCKRKEVELHPCYSWDCDECGRQNYARPVVGDFDAATFDELRTEHGIEPWETGLWLVVPDEVQCRHCNSKFTAAIQDFGG